MKHQKANSITAIGIDVASRSLSICLMKKDGSKEFRTIKNVKTAILNFARSLESFSGKIIMESTGSYHLLSAVTLTEQGFEVCVINPLMMKKYSQSSIRKVKTDKQDAFYLAQMDKEKKLKIFKASRKDLEITKKINLLRSLEKTLQKFKSMLKDFKQTKEVLELDISPGEQNLFDTIKELEKQKRELEKEIEEANQEEKEVAKITAIPGISHFVAVLILHFFDRNINQKAQQWIAYCGLDIAIYESGKWKGKGHLTKRGNVYLRKRLFCAAWGACMHNEEFKKYYQYLREKGRNYSEALTIISRKLVKIIFILLKNNLNFDIAKCNFSYQN